MDDQDFIKAPASRQAIKPPRRKTKLALGLIFLALAVGAIIWIVAKPHNDPTPRGRFAASASIPVAAAPAQKGDMPVVLNELGAVTPLATVTVKTQISGQLQQIAFKEGQMVKAGDFLAQVDPRPFQVALEQAEGTLTKDQALLANQKIDLVRYQKLFKEDSVAEQTLATQVSLVAQQEGQVKTDIGIVDSSKLNLTYCHIIAPATGRLGLRQVDQGNYIQPTDANGIVLLTQLQPMTVAFTVPEDNLPDLMKRVKTGADLQVTVWDRSQTTKIATGKLATIDNTIDPTTGTVKMKAIFDNTDNELFPSQFVNAALQLDVLHDVTLIPVSAIQRGAPGTFVYVVKPDKTVTVRVVTLGPQDSTNVAITKGLELGEMVVIDGADKLREGAAVTLPEAKPPQAAGPGGAATDTPDPAAKPERRHKKDPQ